MYVRKISMLKAHSCCSLLLLHCKCCESLQHTPLPHITPIVADSHAPQANVWSFAKSARRGIYRMLKTTSWCMTVTVLCVVMVWQFQACQNIITQNLFALKFHWKYYENTADDATFSFHLNACFALHKYKCTYVSHVWYTSCAPLENLADICCNNTNISTSAALRFCSTPMQFQSQWRQTNIANLIIICCCAGALFFVQL